MQRRTLLKALAAGGVLPLAAGAAAPAASTTTPWRDVLDTPAQKSPLAARGLLTGLARAGKRLVAVGQRGHVLLSEVSLESRPVLQLGPLSVHPDRQRQGIGSALTEAALAEAERQSEPLVLLVGHPAYYRRFGFEQARKLGIEPPIAVADEAWLVKRLAAYEPHHRGRVTWPPAWQAV